MELGRIYFFTSTIHNWLPLLKEDSFKEIVISSLRFLQGRGLIRIYGFVIMPNHIHLIWEILEMNGKESPHTSFLKFTAHQFLKSLSNDDPYYLGKFKVDLSNKFHSFWQRDSLPIEIYTPSVVFQKLEYLHQNPCRGKWMLADYPREYRFSSMEFYESGRDRFGFLTHIGERI